LSNINIRIDRRIIDERYRAAGAPRARQLAGDLLAELGERRQQRLAVVDMR
jgi:hypothetical protein